MSAHPIGPDEANASGVPPDRDREMPSEELESGEEPAATGRRQAKAPWHFKLLLVGSVGYLGWRAYQGVSWLAHHIH